jgi:hypothetical protein
MPMGLLIVFTFLFIAALAAPFVWVAWWGTDSFVGEGLRPAAAPVRRPDAATVTARFERPHAADLRLARLAKAIAVYRPGDRAAAESCQGPDATGRCPRRLADGTVPCAGMVLSLPRPVRGSTEWSIPAGYDACLVGGYGVFRQGATPS